MKTTENTLIAYLVCALWSSMDESGDPLDDIFSVDDIDPASIKAARADLDAFLSDVKEAEIDLSAWDDEQIGHDFWLTRNGHGTGFWDRPDRENGKRLTVLCKPYGSSDAYAGDDGKIYLT